jgi:membrane-associated protease RseP (regulator of RpoE activity)
MGSVFGVVVFIVSLLAIVMIHEGGHYLMARWFDFRVLEYFVGFGPRLFSFRKKGIEYGVKAFPVGGYVKIAGMNPFVNDVPTGDERRAYGAKPMWQRVMVILAGPLSHFVVAAILFSILLATVGDGHAAHVDAIDPTLNAVPSPAATAGMLPGDLIVRFGDVDNPDQGAIGSYMGAHPGQTIPIVVERDGRLVELTATPVIVAQGAGQPRYRLGIIMGSVPYPIPEAIGHGILQVGTASMESARGIVRAFGPAGVARMWELLTTDAERTDADVASVVGVGSVVGSLSAEGEWAVFAWIFAYVVLFIGLLNLLPLPPLDGGHIAIMAIEKVRGRTIDMKKVVPVSAAVLLFLGFFSLSAIVLDIWKPIPAGP